MGFMEEFLGPSQAPSQLSKEDGSNKSSSFMDEHLPRIVIEEPAVKPVKRIVGAPRSDDPVESQRLLNEGEEAQSAKQSNAMIKAGINAATTYGKDVKDIALGSAKYGFEGLTDIQQGNIVPGASKAILGASGYMLSPVLAPIKEATEFGDKITGKANPTLPTDLAGNPLSDKPINVASPTERLFSGIPVAKAGQVAAKTLPSNKAVTAIIDTIGKENLPAVIQELKSNERLSLMDVVPATRQMAQKLITTEGQHQNKFEKWVTDRIGSAKGATGDIYDASMGVPVNIVDKVNSLKEAAKKVGKTEIEPALAGSGFVDVSKVINNIDAKLKPGVNSVISAGEPLALGDIEKPLAAVRKFIMDDKSVRTDPNSLHQFQSALRAKADDLLNSQNGQDRQIGHALMKVRNDIVKAIDDVSPRIIVDGKEVGSYKNALGKYKDEMEIQNAFQMGQLVTRNKLGRLEDSPEFWDKWVKGASKEELEAAREGARLAVQHQIGGFKAGARKGQDIVESEFNREKLSKLFGKEEIDQMTKLLKDERNIAQTNQQLIGNSQTAMRMKADSRVDLPQQKPSSLLPIMATGAEILGNSQGLPGVGAAAVIGTNLAGKAAHNWARLPMAKARNEHITDLLTATGEDRANLIKMLEDNVPGRKQSMLRNFALPVLPP